MDDRSLIHGIIRKGRACLRALRVHHYMKNLLVFTALASSGRLFEPKRAAAVALGFLAFCALSSAVYLVNDLRDIERDRLHPVKRHRPIAAGEVTVREARLLIALLVLAAASCAVRTPQPSSALLLAAYAALNIAYSFGLKDVPLVDVTILMSGFVIRALYGSVIAQVQISGWLYLVTLSGAFFFSFGKRRNELRRVGDSGETRVVLRAYPESFLDRTMYMCLALTNTFYALWCMDETTTEHYGRLVIWTVPVVLLITMRYSYDIESGSDGDPVEALLHDGPLIVMGLVFLGGMFSMLYLLPILLRYI